MPRDERPEIVGTLPQIKSADVLHFAVCLHHLIEDAYQPLVPEGVSARPLKFPLSIFAIEGGLLI